MSFTILDCYTDEASGLGVPPYLGVYPRYIYGYLKSSNPKENINYITVDDLRFLKKYNLIKKETKESEKTNIRIYNLTENAGRIQQIVKETSTLIVILGVHVPGKYLSAVPGTLKEVLPMIQDLNCKKILTGPAFFGTQLYGGRFYEKADLSVFDKLEHYNFSFDKIKDFALQGTEIINQIPDLRIIEIETGRGCGFGKCSFCTEPIKNKLMFRQNEDIMNEIKKFYAMGERYFRLGKQSCIYSHPNVVSLLKSIRKNCPDIKVLHIDNVDPVKVVTDRTHEITKAMVQYCTPGNIAAFGVESFDPVVVKENTLNSMPRISYNAIKILNKYGAERGDNGLPKFLPGINIIFGLMKETKKTHQENMKWFKKILKENLMLRRINIRQVAIFKDTKMMDVGNKYLRKNRKYYWKWRNQIRQEIDNPMLEKVAPKGTILKNVRTEIYDGKTTFARQIGTYPLIVGIKGRLPLNEFYNVRVTGHMLRSLTGEVA